MKCKALLNGSCLVIRDWRHGNKVAEHAIDEK